MSDITSEETILKLQHIFNRFRIPETLVSDNGTAFTSKHMNSIASIQTYNFDA